MTPLVQKALCLHGGDKIGTNYLWNYISCMFCTFCVWVSHCHPRRNKLLWPFTPRLLPHLTMSSKKRVTGWTKSPSLNWDSNPRHSNIDTKQLIHWIHSFKPADKGSNSIGDTSLHRPTYLYLNEKREEVRIHEAFNKKLQLWNPPAMKNSKSSVRWPTLNTFARGPLSASKQC